MDTLRARVALVLGDDVMQPHCKDDVIARLVAKRWPAEARALWYRRWCSATKVFCSSVDLERVVKGRRRELHRPLPWGTER